MARIQDPLGESRPVARQSGGIARMGARGPSEAPGQAIMQLGRDIGAAGEEIYRAQKIEEDRINTLRAEDAFTKLRQRQLEFTVADGGFTRLQGEAAVARPIRQEYLKRFDDAEREFAATLSNDEQRARFKPRASMARLQYDEEILRHTAKQADVYAKQVYDGAIGQAQQDATVRWDSPLDVASSLERIRSHVFERAERYDWAAEYRDSVLKEESGKVHTAVIGQALANGNYKYAQFWYEQNKDHVTPEASRALARAVVDGTQREMTSGFNARFLAERESRAGLEKLAQEVVGSDLDETRKNIVHGRILNRVETLDLRAERERLQRERSVSKLITDANSSTLAGMPATIEQLTPIYEAAKGTELEPEARQMVNLANATAGFARMTPIAQSQAITQAETQVRADPTKFDRRVLESWKSIYSSQQTLLAKDPVTFAVRQGIAEPQQLDLSQPAAAAEGLAGRYALARSMQAKYGAPMLPLTEPEVKLVSSALEGAGWKERRDYLGGLFQASGSDLQGYMGIMAQLAPDDPVTAIAGSVAARGRGSVADLMLRGQAIIAPSRKADGKPDGGSLYPMPPETDLRMRFDNYVREAFGGRPEARNSHYQAAKAVYAALSVDEGDRNTKDLNGERWEQAINLAVGPVQKHQSRRVILPAGYDYDQFKDGLQRRLQQVVDQGGLDPSWTAPRLMALPLENVGDGRYVLRAGDGVVSTSPTTGKAQIRNADGSISTESTITIEADGRHVVLPTIMNGKRVSEDQAVAAWRKGTNQAVGVFGTAGEADKFARARTARLSSELVPKPLIIDFNQSAPFVPSGHGRTAQSPFEQWMLETGGVLGAGENQEMAMERWARERR